MKDKIYIIDVNTNELSIFNYIYSMIYIPWDTYGSSKLELQS